ncbi:MAG: DNA translocase FtsK [Bryobacterales bacterium]|nr:DNA translocase FtsK [Bryobacterales bacterium]
MRFLGPTRHHRLNEAAGVVYLVGALVLSLSLYSFYPGDPSFNTATPDIRVQNLIGKAGSYTSDLLFQLLGWGAWVLPAAVFALAVKWLRSRPIQVPFVKAIGFFLLVLGSCTGLALIPWLHPLQGVLPPGGLAGVLVADSLVSALNQTGAAFLTATTLFVSLYLVSSFSLAKVPVWFEGPRQWQEQQKSRWRRWKDQRALNRLAKQQLKEERARAKAAKRRPAETVPGQAVVNAPPAAQYAREDRPPWEEAGEQGQFRAMEPTVDEAAEQEIPICVLEEPEPFPPPPPRTIVEPEPMRPANPPRRRPVTFDPPSTTLLNEAPVRSAYDGQELKEIAGRIKSKLEEFNVLGSVVQINPGPVVTTFEYKPEAGIKYSRIVTLTEDLCLGLQAESIFIERLPGKPTVGIEVPNTRREVISLRQILESEEFSDSGSKLTICLGKDINGRIKVASLEAMPHLLIAGSTGSGKSVMLNSLIMSILYKATPDEVRMVLVDPKRVEMGIYEGIPHLLTPVITDAKQATNALRNAVLEMERRLKLLASQGVRNIEQFNKKLKQAAATPRSLFEEEEPAGEQEQLKPLPYILIVIDELADLMMLERANVEASVTRLAQMARAVGMHLVLATQRPSVDVITGLIKANFPSRISFRVATRVDSRTVLDVMGAEHLLGRGDMLYLPPGSSRLVRVHGALVTENEINRVVEHWRDQALPDYDESYLKPPPSEDDDLEIGSEEEGGGVQDAMYQEAVRVVLEMGKASTSILQRRLRLGYGRAARILDMMHRDGIIGPPDGSRPREVLKRPDWLDEIEQ